MDWRKEYDEGYAALRKQTKEGAAFSVCVVPVSAIQKNRETDCDFAEPLVRNGERGGDGEHVA
jgi:hypothetical protein